MSSRSGVTLIGIIAAIVVMGLLGAGVLMLVSTGSMESIQTLNQGQAFFAAESGVSEAKAYRATNANPTTITGTVGQASFTAIVDANGQITSVGVCNEARWTSICMAEAIPSGAAAAMLVYGTSTNAGTPRYQIWGGTNWSSPSNALKVGSSNINWVVVKACPTRDEYIAATIDTGKVVKAQVYRNGTWGNLQTITNVPNAKFRGVDVAYETLSGDAMVVAADKTNVTYYVWKTNTWTGPTKLDISTNGIVLWVKLASDPVSDEIIVMVQNTNKYYTAQVWNGSNAWGNVKRPVALSPGTNYESMAVEYETSGNQAIIVSGNAALSSFKWSSWDGTNWSSERTNALNGYFYFGTLVTDPYSDKLLFTYIDNGTDVGKVFWNETNWTAYLEFDTSAETLADRCIDGVFETISGHAGHAIAAYGDGEAGSFQHATDPSGSTWSTAAAISTFDDTATMQTRRTGDGKILAISFNLTGLQYDFSWWNGTTWSAKLTLENEPSVRVTPFKEPFMMAPQLWVSP